MSKMMRFVIHDSSAGERLAIEHGGCYSEHILEIPNKGSRLANLSVAASVKACGGFHASELPDLNNPNYANGIHGNP